MLPPKKAIVLFKYFTWMCNFRWRKGLRIEWALLEEQPLILWAPRYPAGLHDEMFSLQLRKALHGEMNRACTHTAIRVGKTRHCLLVDSKAPRDRKAQWHCPLQALTSELGCRSPHHSLLKGFSVLTCNMGNNCSLPHVGWWWKLGSHVWNTENHPRQATDWWSRYVVTFFWMLLLQRAENWAAAGQS